jgi:hypothetical protein
MRALPLTPIGPPRLKSLYYVFRYFPDFFERQRERHLARSTEYSTTGGAEIND